MCLAIPGKVIEIMDENGLKMGNIDYSGTTQKACLAYLPDIQIGQYVIVHAGFALNAIDEEEAKKTLALWNEIAEKNAKEGLDPFGTPIENKNQAGDN